MAFKFVVLCAVLAVANAGLSPVVYSAPVGHYAVANPSVDAVGETQHNVVRSYAGTVSQYSKAVDTPYSSVRKSDTRINNNVYTPAYAKTVAYAAPQAVYAQHAAPTTVYAHAAPATYHATAPATVYSHAPAQATVYSHAPAQATVYSHAPAQAAVYSHAPAQATVYSHAPAQAAVYSHAAPTAVVAHHAPSTYVSHVDPTIAAYSSKTISYSPAASVAHVTFDGFGAHYGY